MRNNGKVLIFGLIVLFMISLACTMSGQTSMAPYANTETAISLRITQLALDANQLTLESLRKDLLEESSSTPIVQVITPTIDNLVPTEPEMLQPPTETETQVVPTLIPPTNTPTLTDTPVPVSDKLILQVSTDRKVFHCISSDGPTALTISVSLSDVNQGMAVFWRLEDKMTGRKTDWDFKDMRRSGGNNRAFTFDADVWGGTNNFFYPPLMGESWFQYQIIAGNNSERTDIVSDVTFFPCAQ